MCSHPCMESLLWKLNHWLRRNRCLLRKSQRTFVRQLSCLSLIFALWKAFIKNIVLFSAAKMPDVFINFSSIYFSIPSNVAKKHCLQNLLGKSNYSFHRNSFCTHLQNLSDESQSVLKTKKIDDQSRITEFGRFKVSENKACHRVMMPVTELLTVNSDSQVVEFLFLNYFVTQNLSLIRGFLYLLIPMKGGFSNTNRRQVPVDHIRHAKTKHSSFSPDGVTFGFFSLFNRCNLSAYTGL